MDSKPSDTPDAHYDQVSEAWRYLMGESFHYGYFDGQNTTLDAATHALTEKMASKAGVKPGDHVLDIGCGIGAPARQLARSIDCHVTGISNSAVGVALAEQETIGTPLRERVSFEVRDAMDNGLPAQAFDCAWALESSHLMPDKQRMLREACRVLVPGGRLVLCDIIVHRDLPIQEVVRQAKPFDLLRRVFGRAKMETLSTYRKWLEELDMQEIWTEDISRQTAPTLPAWAENADRYRSEVVELIGETAWSEFRESCEVLRSMWKEEILGYGLVVAQGRDRTGG
jgi:27-O-demethylrifamycin SV methyltransferase